MCLKYHFQYTWIKSNVSLFTLGIKNNLFRIGFKVNHLGKQHNHRLYLLNKFRIIRKFYFQCDAFPFVQLVSFVSNWLCFYLTKSSLHHQIYHLYSEFNEFQSQSKWIKYTNIENSFIWRKTKHSKLSTSTITTRKIKHSNSTWIFISFCSFDVVFALYIIRVGDESEGEKGMWSWLHDGASKFVSLYIMKCEMFPKQHRQKQTKALLYWF